jgi:hypothetical protein
MSKLSDSKKVSGGGNTPAPAGAVVVPSFAMPGNDGGVPMAPKAGGGGTISRHSPRKNTRSGRRLGPPPVSADTIYLPYNINRFVQRLRHDGAVVECCVFSGSGRLVVGGTSMEMGPGEWILSRISGAEGVDGAMPSNVIFSAIFSSVDNPVDNPVDK